MHVSGRGVQPVCKDEVEPRDTKEGREEFDLVVGLLLPWGQESNQRS